MNVLLRPVLLIAGALLSAGWAWRRLHTLPEPADDPDDAFVKPTYASLTSGGNFAWLLGCTVAGGALASTLPGWWTPLAWSLLAGGGSVLALVDLRTTYLPTRLLRPLGVAVSTLLLGRLVCAFAQPAGDAGELLARVVGGAVASRLLFWCMWRFRAGLGFGDVRLATLLGLLTAAVSASMWRRG